MDRIVHTEIEAFKTRVYNTEIHGYTIGTWNRLLSKGDESVIRNKFAERFGICDEGRPVNN